MTSRPLLRTLAAALAAFAAGCDSDLLSAWEVTDPEVRAVKVEVVRGRDQPDWYDPDQAWPREGDTLRVRVQVPSAETPPDVLPDRYLDVAATICVGLIAPTGELFCFAQLELPRELIRPQVVAADEVDFTVPVALGPLAELDATDLRDQFGDLVPSDVPVDALRIDALMLVGAVCFQGTARRVEGTRLGEHHPYEAFECVENQASTYRAPMAFIKRVELDLQGDKSNRNPSFACQGPPVAPAGDPPPAGAPLQVERRQAAGACATGVAHDDEPGVEVVPGSVVLIRPPLEGYAGRFPQAAPAARAVAMPLWSAAPRGLPFEHGCADPSGPQWEVFKELLVPVGSGEHKLELRFDTEDFDPLSPEEQARYTYRTEELIVSHLIPSELGSLKTLNSVLAPDLPAEKAFVQTTYTPPSRDAHKSDPVPDDGRLVRFFLQVRDQRGGTDFAQTALCLVPPR